MQKHGLALFLFGDTMPSLMQRAKNAITAFRGAPPVAVHATKAMPFLWPDYRTGTPIWKIINYSTYALEGFSQNAVIYSAIMYKVRSMTIAPLRAWTGTLEDREAIEEGHPLAQLVSRPNTHQSWSEFQGQATVYLNISGNNFTYLDRRSPTSLPEAMYNLRPDRVFIVPGKVDDQYTVLGYLYVPEGKSQYLKLDCIERRRKFEQGEVRAFLPEDMMHVKLPNPLDRYEGMGEGLSPIGAMAWNADVDNSVTKYLKLFFQHGVMVPGFFTSDNPLSEPDIARFKERYKEIYGGFENWAEEIMVTDKGVKYQRIGLTFDEMGFEPIDERSESRMTGPFGVPPILIGARIGLKHATYSNYREARQAFWQDTMVPESLMFQAEYQYYLKADDGAFVAYDYSKVPALQEVWLAEREEWRADFTASAITRNEYRQKLRLEPDPRGNVYVTPLSMIEVPFGAMIEAPPLQPEEGMEESPEATEDERKSLPLPHLQLGKGLQAEAKLRCWKQVNDIAESWEEQFADKTVDAFKVDERALLARLHRAKRKAIWAKQTVDYQQVARDWDEYFATVAPENWREEFFPVITGVITDQAEAWNTAFGISFDVTNIFAVEAAGDFFREFMDGFATDIIQTTRADMTRIIEQALSNGWTVDETSKQLGLTFERYITEGFVPEVSRRLTEQEIAWFTDRRPQYRRDNIARTETIRASNAGSLALFEAWGVVELKEWLATGDDRTREDHLVAWSQYSEGGDPGPVSLHQAFIVGGSSLMYPGDPSGPPEQVCQCRCTVLPFFADLPSAQAELQQQRELIDALQPEQAS